MTTYVRTHGRRLRWTVATLKQAGIEVRKVTPGTVGDYFIAVDADAETVDAALLTMTGYQRKSRRKPLEVQAMDALLIGGLIAAIPVALVTPAGGALVVCVTVFSRFVLGKLRTHANVMRSAGGWHGAAASVWMPVMLLLVAGFILIAGGMAGMQIAAGNSALSLLSR